MAKPSPAFLTKASTADACKIEDLSKATPHQLAQLQAGLEVAQALQELNAADVDRTPPEGRDCFFQSSLTKARIPLTAIWSIAP
jgi:hypothetical protein